MFIFIVYRWLRTFDIATAPQTSQRSIAKEWSGDDFCVEMAPFQFPLAEKKGQFEIKAAAWSYIEDLPSHIITYVQHLYE